jgi:hypothetical protein
MKLAQVYCTVDDLMRGLELDGDEGIHGTKKPLIDFVRSASDQILRAYGNIIPISATYLFGAGPYESELLLDKDLLEITSIINDTTTLSTSDYVPWPLNRHWDNGPYTRIHTDGTWDDDNVQITGLWGLWEYSKATGEAAISQDGSQATLTVLNGANVSPGMVLLIESEQELVTGYAAPSVLTSVIVGSSVDDETAIIPITNGAEVHEGEMIRCEFEDMIIRMIVGNSLMCGRAQNGTEKAVHAAGTAIYAYRTVSVDRNVNGTTAAAHASKAASRYTVPDIIEWMALQIAALMYQKAAKTKFSGKLGNSGSADGDVYYINEFPTANDKIRKLFRRMRG